jgi:hypothetical protein
LADGRITQQKWEFIRTTSILCRALGTWASPSAFQTMVRATIAPPFFNGSKEDAA